MFILLPGAKPTPFEDYYESIIYALQSAFWLNHFSNPRYKTHISQNWWSFHGQIRVKVEVNRMSVVIREHLVISF